MAITRIHHAQITIPPGAEADARSFYCDLLGLGEVPKPESLIGRGGFWLQIADAQVHVGVEKDVDRLATKAHVAYEVDDLQSLREKLNERGIKIIEGIPVPGYERFEIRDPFGNRVEFLQPT